MASRSLKDPTRASDELPAVADSAAPVIGMLAAAARAHGDRAALVHGDGRVTYAELEERVARLAHGLAATGVAPGDPVALVLREGTPFVTSFLAVIGLGAVAVPLNPQYKEAELRFSMSDCGVRAVIASGERAMACREIVAGWDAPAPVIAADGTGGGALAVDALIDGHAPAALDGADPDEDAVFQYSAGCTGGAKRVPRTQGQLRAEADSFVATVGLGPDDVILGTIPLFHSYGMGCCLLAALRSAATLVILDGSTPFVLQRDHALRVLERERVTVLPTVPFILRLLGEAPGSADLSALRLCFSAAAALPHPTFEAFDARIGIPVRQLYGSTEAGAVTANLDDDPAGTWRSVGRPLQGVEIEILDPNGDPMEPDRIGEIAVRSPAMTRGYAGLDDLNRDVFRDGWFRTNDRGRVDAEGRVHIAGRTRVLIDVGGDKVDPVEVEDVLAVHPRVHEVVVVGVDSGDEGEDRVKAVVVPDGPLEARELIRFARDRLANYKAPQMVEFREEIPKSASGEVLRKYLV